VNPEASDGAAIPSFGKPTAGFSLIERPSAYVVVRDTNGAVAVVRTPKGHYLPGGGIDAGETPEQTVVRETCEEAGVRISADRIFAHAIQFVFSAEECACFAKDSVFFAGVIVGRCAATEPDHHLLWLLPQEALRLLTHESHRWALEKIIATNRED
jgi:8-oxo-dGTP diphosphatase